MAKAKAVWGIDIGQSALKALRCVQHEDQTRIVADAFDYIEYPKILSQPDVTNAPELIREALQQFLSRNKLRGDKVVISVPGQSGLARFIKLPPVESSKIPDIVRYEAKQQIPFPLDEVVWDYQQISGGSEEGFALETEVGLFAMKRDQVYRALQPFSQVDVEVDIIQLTPLSLFNFVLFDQLTDLPSDDDYDPDNPPESCVVLSLGTDTTDLVVTNGFRVWQRSIPIGGSHFTKALVKDLRMNFGTAEHLKRNASNAEDPKALFQAMRPVFNDLLTEVQRSIGYFKNNVDRAAQIGRVIALGNVMKLPGLQKYLAQNLGYELVKVERFRGLEGGAVSEAPAFKENLLAFGVCYGLALQGLGVGRIRTNLLPREITQQRIIRAKKPWVAAAAALLLLGFSLSYFLHHRARESVALDSQSPLKWKQSMDQAAAAISEQQRLRDEYDGEKQKFVKTMEVGESLLQNVQSRDAWMQVLTAVNLCLPRDASRAPRPGDTPRADDPAQTQLNVGQRNELKIDSFECLWSEDLAHWFANTAQWRDKPAEPTPMPDGSEPPPVDGEAPPAAPVGPVGGGWVFRVRGHHYHNLGSDPGDKGISYVIKTLVTSLEQDEVPGPGTAGAPVVWPVKKLGIGYPVVIGRNLPNMNYQRPAREGEPLSGGRVAVAEANGRVNDRVGQPRQDFEVQFVWQPEVYEQFKNPEKKPFSKPATTDTAQAR